MARNRGTLGCSNGLINAGLINASELVLDVKNADRVTTTARLRGAPAMAPLATFGLPLIQGRRVRA